MYIRECIDNFYENINNANNLLKENTQSIDERKHEIKLILDSLDNEYHQAQIDENTSEIKKIYIRQLREYDKEIKSYLNIINRYIDGKTFVNKFEKSILLIVFADVKAGKSTLGNFISGYDFKETDFEDMYKKPQFYVYDYSNETDKENKGEKILKNAYFEEDEIEATSTIQYFTLNEGLTWVDTPGINSLTIENEELAKEYTKFADLILFLTPSNNPFKQDEANQIKKLIQYDKPLLITITKSDIKTRTVKNEKLITLEMSKSLEIRNEQENYLSREIEKMGGKNILSKNEYISISTRMARIALKENDEEKFISSNIPKLYKQIGDVISKKALMLKLKRPKDEVNTAISEIIEGIPELGMKGINNIIKDIEDVSLKILEYKNKVDDSKNEILIKAKQDILVELHQKLYELKLNNKIQENEYLDSEISKIIEKNLYNSLNEAIGGILSDFKIKGKISPKVSIDSKYEKKKEIIEYEVLEANERTREARGIVEHLQKWILKKEFTYISTRTITMTKEIDVGDNYSEFVSQIWDVVEIEIKNIIEKQLDLLKNDYFEMLEGSVLKIKQNLLDSKSNLVDLKFC